MIESTPKTNYILLQIHSFSNTLYNINKVADKVFLTQAGWQVSSAFQP